jgi:predicted Zn-dependent peptidase
MSSKLFQEVREKRGLVYNVKSFGIYSNNFANLLIYAGCDKSNIQKVVDLCLSEFEKMKNISEKELSEAKEQLKGNLNIEKEDSEEVAQALILNEILGKAEDYYSCFKEIDKISLDDIKKISMIKDYSLFILE